ncbi:MAG: DNA polymerase/3'-5' exonuclease PolX [Nitrospirae bacterium]|nr:DNA polymerase/3'-5' exonuclease PolX [Nitrospirota bacterium]
MDRKEVGHILEEIGILLELKGENPFKCNAYHAAARTLEALEGDLAEQVRTGALKEVKGIGKALFEKISELVTTGRLPYYEELRGSIPAGLLEIIKLPGVGPKKAKALHDLLGIASVGELEYACVENRLVDLPGFGVRSQEKILEGIRYYKKAQGLHLFPAALTEAEILTAALRKVPGVTRADYAGSLRRRKEVIRDIDLVAAARDPGRVMDAFAALPEIQTVLAKGETKAGVLLHSGIQADLRVVSDAEFPFALLYFTGSKEHNTALRGRARRLGLKLNEYGLFREEEPLPCRDEDAVFARLGLTPIPPELREDMGEIEAAEKGRLPQLVEPGDVRGVSHGPTTASDGGADLREMVLKAKNLGYRYVGISDHSRSAHYANGLSVERVRAQHREIDKLRKEIPGIAIFKGIESDILADGSLDYPDEILATFDFVIASIHSRFQMTEREMTDRILRAVANPYTTMLGHPTGRLLLSREGYAVDLKKIIDAAAERKVVIELNANPYRLDLDWRLCRYTHDRGVRVSINPDAHSPEGLEDTVYGVGIARKGGLTKDDVLNTMTAEKIEEYLSSRKAAKR